MNVGRVLLLFSLTWLVSCGASSATAPSSAEGGASAGGTSADGGAEGLGMDCVGPRGDLYNYFCGQRCTRAEGQRPGVNCGRACIGEADEIRGGNCTPPQPYGGIYGRCLEAGEQFEAKVIGAVCCEGLERISLEMPTAQGCDSEAAPSILLCAPCGNDTCDEAENACNCPADCD